MSSQMYWVNKKSIVTSRYSVKDFFSVVDNVNESAQYYSVISSALYIYF